MLELLLFILFRLRKSFFIILLISFIPLSYGQDGTDPVDIYDDLDNDTSSSVDGGTNTTSARHGGDISNSHGDWAPSFFEKLKNDAINGLDDGGYSLHSSIFEALTNITLIDEAIGPLNLGLSIERRTFDNHDLADTWTVMDFFRLPISLPLIPPVSAPIGPVSLGISATGRIMLNSLHIRQVSPDSSQDITKLKNAREVLDSTLKDLPAELKESVIYNKDEEKETFWEKTKRLFTLNFKNPQTQARYHKLYNLLLSPLGIPVTQKQLLKMPANDIRVFGIDGMLELSGHVGWSISAVPGIDTLKLGAGITTYVGGKWKVALFKEDETTLQIKITRIKNKGNRLSLGATHSFNVFEGFMVLGQNIGKITESIVPFSFQLGNEQADTFDIGYRYDLKNPKALEAAHKAMFGLTKQSEELSADPANGVKWIYSRKQQSNSHESRYSLRLSFLFERASGNRVTASSAIVVTPEGTHHIFKGIAETYKFWDSIFGGRESQNYSFNTIIDRKEYYTNKEGGALLRLTGTIEDARTSGKELARYIREVEEMAHDPGLYPEFPVYNPPKNCQKPGKLPRRCKKQGSVAKYGKSTFYYRIGLGRVAMDAFIKTPYNNMWGILEGAHKIKKGTWSTAGKRALYQLKNGFFTFLNLPLAVVNVHIKKGGDLISAKRFFKYWRKIRHARSVEELTKRMANVFATRHYGPELIKTVLVSVQNHQIEFYVSSKVEKLFGQFTKVTNPMPDPSTQLSLIHQRLDFERNDYWIRVNEKANIGALEVTKIDDDTLNLKINFGKVPELVYFAFNRKTGWGGYKQLGRFIVANMGRFTEGENNFVVKRKDDQGSLFKFLSHYMFKSTTMEIKVAYSIKDAEGWGPVSSARYRPPKEPEKVEDPQ